MPRSFSLAEDHFGEALAQGAMVIDLGEAQILERQMLEAQQRLASRDFAHAERFEKLANVAFVHESIWLRKTGQDPRCRG